MAEPPFESPPLLPGHSSVASAPRRLHESSLLTVIRCDGADYDRDAQGRFSYLYRFAWYDLTTTRGQLRARRYADSWSEVSIFPTQGESWKTIPYADPAFGLVVRYFASLDDVRRIQAFVAEGEGYEPVDLAHLAPGPP